MIPSPTEAPPKKILVVDDNEIVIKTITLKLQGAGYQVLAAMDGSEAVALARSVGYTHSCRFSQRRRTELPL